MTLLQGHGQRMALSGVTRAFHIFRTNDTYREVSFEKESKKEAVFFKKSKTEAQCRELRAL